MSAAINNVTAPDAFEGASTLLCPKSVRVRIFVSNQAIWWQRGYGPPGGEVRWELEEEFLPPSSYSLTESCDALRFRAAVPAAQIPAGQHQAQVTVTTRTLGDLGE